MADTAYKANPLLKQRGVEIQYTKEQVKEVIKCSNDPEYFLHNYIKVISLDDGIVPFHPYPFQQELITSFHDNRFTICKLPRQSGKSVTVTAYLIHQDRKSTRLNSSHLVISYAVFCLKKKIPSSSIIRL